MSLTAVSAPACIDLFVADVTSAAAFFRRVLALPVHLHDRGRADVDLGSGIIARLRTAPDRPISEPRDQPGVILQLLAPDLNGALAELRRRGATVLVEPVLTEWDTRSAFVAGPDGMVVEVYRPL
jgi:catechol 2,3-dioxygenase-like lactoylglutathione lyase family enzyme